ncbi:hypothetical protein QZH41_012488, partial [Actinostola sp. cb2023]
SSIACVHKRHSPTKVVALVGTSVLLNCSTVLSTNDSNPSNITWYKFEQPLRDVTFRSMDIVFKYGRHSLWLSEVLLADAGTYVCERATRGIKPEKQTFSLSIKETKSRLPPSIVNSNKEHKYMNVGENIVLGCQARCSTVPYFQWLYRYTINRNEIVIKKPREASTVSVRKRNGTRFYEDFLSIDNATYRDSGTYVCLAFSKHGKAYKEIHLTVFAEPTESLKDLEQQHASTNNESSISSKIPMIILIALPAGLFLLSCTAVIRSLERARQAKLANKQEVTVSDAKDVNDNQLPTMGMHTNYNYDYCNHNESTTTGEDDHVGQRSISASASTSSALEIEIESTSSPLANLSNLSRQSSCQLSSTEAPVTTSPPPELSSSSAGLELEWEGLDMCLPEGSELVKMSKEAEV